MPPILRRRLLTALHTLVIAALLCSSLPLFAVNAMPKEAASTAPVSQKIGSEEDVPEYGGPDHDAPTDPTRVPAPLIAIPEATNPVAPYMAPIPAPADRTYDGMPLPDVGRNVESVAELTSPRLPIAMSVELDRYLLMLLTID